VSRRQAAACPEETRVLASPSLRMALLAACLLSITPAPLVPGQAGRRAETPAAAAGAGATAGISVEEVAKGSPAEKAGLRAGDLLLSWQRAAAPPAGPRGAEGRLSSPFDLYETEREQAPRGPVRLAGSREGVPRRWQMPQRAWGIAPGPPPAPWAAAYREGLRRFAAGDPRGGVRRWNDVAAGLERSAEPELASWLELRAAQLADDHGDWKHAEPALAAALRIARAHCRPAVTARVESMAADAYERHEQLARALALLETAFARRQRLEPGSISAATILSEIAYVRMQQGDSAAAESAVEQALAFTQRLAPGSLAVSLTVTDLGVVRLFRGDLLGAEDCFRRALAIDEKLDPDSLYLAADLVDLGNLARRRNDLTAAEEFHRRALALRQRLAPHSPDAATSLTNVADTVTAQGRAAEAESLWRQALAEHEKLRPGSWEVGQDLVGLGQALVLERDFPGAEAALRRGVAILEATTPRNLNVGLGLGSLSRALAGQGRGSEAAQSARRGLAIVRATASGTDWDAEVCLDLAEAERSLGHLGAALQLFEQALRVLDSLAGRLGGAAADSLLFAGRFADFYQGYVETLIALGRQAEAYQALERYRARGFLALLAEREAGIGRDVPPKLERERRQLSLDYDHALAQLASADAEDRETHEALQRELEDLRHRRHDLESRLRAATTRPATLLRSTPPVDLAETLRTLDPGTLLLSYAIGSKESYLFAVGPGSAELNILHLPVARDELREQVRRFRSFIEQSHEAADRDTALRLSEKLASQLLTPAAAQIARASRLLIVPDGALHLLPFAALAEPGARPARFLIEGRPLATVASATVYAELKRRRRPAADARPVRLVAFGDPAYPSRRVAEASPEPALQSALRSGLRLDPLPGARAEVESLAAIYTGAQILVGNQATEERAKQLAGTATLLHFACHAVLDERVPLDSALALTIPESRRPGQENGLLQAWEVFDQLHLDADLVTLSACQSALGKELGGEGLMGLTRAFQYAGARTVLASLWNVSDASTAELMKRFYTYLRAGQAKTDALRAAQLDLLHGSIRLAAGAKLDPSHPFYWAAFELIGDDH
jgi:CHAT domain-containing protein